MYRQIFIFFLSFVLFSCGGNNGSSSDAAPTATADDNSNYNIEKIPGTNIERAFKQADTGQLLEEGFIVNGKRNGTWITYHLGKTVVKSTISYVNGQLNGPYIEYNDRGQIESLVTYKNGVYDGLFAKYKFSRPLQEATYKNNKLDGMRKIFYENNGKIQSETEYKDGVQHGIHRFYNDKGQTLMEYEYKNGEKVSGETFDPPAVEEDKK